MKRPVGKFIDKTSLRGVRPMAMVEAEAERERENRAKARQFVASNAHDAADCALLLDVLGLVEPKAGS